MSVKVLPHRLLRVPQTGYNEQRSWNFVDEKKCNFNVSFILTEISRVSFSGGYGITRVVFFVVLSKF